MYFTIPKRIIKKKTKKKERSTFGLRSSLILTWILLLISLGIGIAGFVISLERGSGSSSSISNATIVLPQVISLTLCVNASFDLFTSNGPLTFDTYAGVR